MKTCSGTKIGARIKAFREEQGIGIEDLASRSGLHPALLEAIEAGEAQPSIGPLVRLARSLGKRLGTFMDDQETADPHIVRRRQIEEDKSLQTQETGMDGQAYYSLGLGKSDRHMEPFFIELGPGPEGDCELSSHEGEEFIIVVSGKIRITYGREVHDLGPGDSAYYNSIVPHHVAGLGGPASIHAVIYVPC